MNTKYLRSMQGPQSTEDLVESCVRTQQIVPSQARRVTELPDLSRSLRQLVHRHETAGSVWLVWEGYADMWLVVATSSLELSRERGRPVLQLRVHDEYGGLQEEFTCVRTHDSNWERCNAA